MERIKVSFAGLEIEFVDRDRALRQIEELGEKGTFPVYVIYGPEGCGKTSLLKQAKTILEKEFDYYVIYTSPLAEKKEEILQFTHSTKDIVKEVLKLFPDPYSRIVDVAIEIASRVLEKFSKSRLAVLMDDIFQAVGLDKAEIYTKILLNLIEWPPRQYEKIIVLVTTSEGISKSRVGRHNWADLFTIWNMSKEGFRELYEKIPNQKPDFEQIWRWTGGNPRYLERLYRARWDVDKVIDYIVRSRELYRLVASLDEHEISILRESLENPDVLLWRIREAPGLIDKLVELNLIVDVFDRKDYLWFDFPPPERDPELGIGKYYAWQTPLHREAVRRALEAVESGLARTEMKS